MSHYPTDPPRRSVKVAHLVFGVAFVGIAALWALGTRGDIGAGDVPVLLPAVLIGAGVVGLVAAAVAPLLRRRREPTGFEERPAFTPGPPRPGDTTQRLPTEAAEPDPGKPTETDQNDPEDPTKEIR